MKHYKVNKGFITQKIGNRVSIFDPEESLLFTFNETAYTIFKKIKKDIPREQIIEQIVQTYNVSAEVATKDFDALVKQLQAKKIISRV